MDRTHVGVLWAPQPPDNKYAVICLDPGERVTAGGIILADKHQGKVMRWLVVAVGPGKWSVDGSRRLRPQWSVGDVLLGLKLSTFNTYPGHPVHTLGRPVWIVNEEVFFGAVTGVEWDSVPEIALWREEGAAAWGAG